MNASDGSRKGRTFEMSFREWTVGELADELAKHPREAKVKLEDADTNWEVPEFAVVMSEGELWFYPCGYDKIGRR